MHRRGPADPHKPIPGLTEASELKSVGLSHSAAQTLARGPAGPLTTRLVRPTHGSESELGAVTHSEASGGRHLPPKHRPDCHLADVGLRGCRGPRCAIQA